MVLFFLIKPYLGTCIHVQAQVMLVTFNSRASHKCKEIKKKITGFCPELVVNLKQVIITVERQRNGLLH